MDIYRLDSDQKFLNQVGVALTIEERLYLQPQILKLNQYQEFDQLQFWGKIEGTTKDYYVAIGQNFKDQYEFPFKKFFWAQQYQNSLQNKRSSDFQFSELPPINDQLKEEIDTVKTLLSGEFNKIIRGIPEEEEQEPEQNQEEIDEQNKIKKSPEEEDFEEEVIKIPPRNFTELDRLSYIIRAIDHDCSLLPIGSVRLTPSHELRYNDNFKGLTLQSSKEFTNYLHYRRPITEMKRKIISQGNCIFRYDFLDSIEEDLPKGAWSIQTDTSEQFVTIRSLLWPGYVAYHKTNSNIYGGAYFGNGIKNVDLPFFI